MSHEQKIDCEAWLLAHYAPYDGDEAFLAGPTPRTLEAWKKCEELLQEEVKKGVLDVDASKVSTIDAYEPGFLDKEKDLIVGFQTDAPLKRGVKPFGGLLVAQKAAESYGYTLDPLITEIFSKYRKTHNEGVFDVYTSQMRKVRRSHIITGLPDGYGRGRIIGDYRRVALYGVDCLIAAKLKDKEELGNQSMTEENIRLMEEVAEQIKALKKLVKMGKSYGYDVSHPATNAREAIQWTYFAYLAAIKEQDGAAMSLGRVDGFFDVYIEKDIKEGLLTESQAQELIDDFVIKLRLVRHLRTPEYNELFAGDPTWVTFVLGGMGLDNRPLVTRTTYRILQTLYNLGAAPEPNLTVLWTNKLPANFRKFAAKVSIDTSSIQYENDELMTARFGSDYGIACCVSAMTLGKDMQFFGARCNMAKLLLYALNEGRDEISGELVGPVSDAVAEGPLDFEDVKKRFERYIEWLAELYVNTMNVIHYMHDKYCYEALQMALHDTNTRRMMAFGIAGLSVVADSLSAIKYAKVTPVRDERGIAVDFQIEGDFPTFGNDDERVDMLAKWVTAIFIQKLRMHTTYRNSLHTLSILTITSNVVYGKATGSTPDGRKRGVAFAPGANPMHGRDKSGALASLNSVAKLDYDSCLDGISNTFSIIPSTLGKRPEGRTMILSGLLDGYFAKGGFHLNVNVLNRETLMDAVDHPEKYPQLTIRVSGYAVHFVRLTPAQQKDVIARTFHGTV